MVKNEMTKIERDFIAEFFIMSILNDVLIYNHDRAKDSNSV